MRARIKQLVENVLSYLPSRLPQTDAQLDAFIRTTLALGAFPDNDSLRQAIATQIMHLGPLTTFKSKRYFVRMVQSAISKQTAYNLIADIRERAKLAKDGADEQREVLQNG
jgi:hypothetical protein